jgi:hypothetical protein
LKTTTATLALCATATLSLGCGGETYENIYGITTSHKDDGAGTLLEVSASIPRDTLETFHAEERSGNGHQDFSGFVRSESVFDHVGLGYNAHGHGPPGVNDIPHMDAHFYFVSTEVREAIDCDGEPMPEKEQLPPGVEANVSPEPFGGCVKQMGGHGAQAYDKLTANMIYGYHDGELIFVEPMVDVDMLLGKDDVELEVLKPDHLHFRGAYPTRFSMRHTDDKVTFVMAGFTWLE